MGTKPKMDCTMIGSNVNLAARLEGVNKQYGTWMLTREIARAQAGEDIFTRRLDRVRAVGINEPVRLCYRSRPDLRKYLVPPLAAVSNTPSTAL